MTPPQSLRGLKTAMPGELPAPVSRDPCQRCGQNPEHGDCGHHVRGRLVSA